MVSSARAWARALMLCSTVAVAVSACGAEESGQVGSDSQDVLPTEGSCEAAAMLKVANEATLEQLDVDANLDKRAAQNIIAARPFATLGQLDDVAYVGNSALEKLLAYATAEGFLASCEIPADGTCPAAAMLKVANEATLEQLDVDAALDKRAAQSIIAARPIGTLGELDHVSYVGDSALRKILAYASDQGYLAPCIADGAELGILSDLDKTVIPPANPDLSSAPYPGVATLYQILEHRNEGTPGDMYYVTARTPEMIPDVPAYLDQHGVPTGPIETGTSGLPWVAQPEKIADVSGILDATGAQSFVLFGDSSHVDPEVYKSILAAHPERVVAGFIHKVNNTVSPARVEGLHLHENYAEVAAILYGYQVISHDEALTVMLAAQSEGLPITSAEMDALLEANAP